MARRLLNRLADRAAREDRPMDSPAHHEPLYRLPNYRHADAQGVWLLAFAALLLDVAAAWEASMEEDR